MENAPGVIVATSVASRVQHATLPLKMSVGEHALVLLLCSNLSPVVFMIVAGARTRADNNADDDGNSEGKDTALVLLLARNLSTVLVILDGVGGEVDNISDGDDKEGEGSYAVALFDDWEASGATCLAFLQDFWFVCSCIFLNWT